MLASVTSASHNWLCCGREMFPAMLEAIDAARERVNLEIYPYENGPLGLTFLDSLVRAQQRGVRVCVLVDALGSVDLPGSFFGPLRIAGGEARKFNPIRLHR